MRSFFDESIDDFIKANYKYIVCFGAGRVLNDFIKFYENKTDILSDVVAVIDNNPELSNKTKFIRGREVPIYNFEYFLDLFSGNNNIVIIISTNYIYDIIEQLNSAPALKDVPCYSCHSLLYRDSLPPPSGNCDVETIVLSRNYEVPKIIHYCWFGGNTMSEKEKRCIESWKIFCPDYEFKLWNEENYDISDKPKYVKQAYTAKKYAFVSDYVRLDVVNKYGGVYLDTDVKLLKSIDKLLRFKSFFCFESYNLVATGLGFGSISDNKILQELINIYNDMVFINKDGTLNMTACPFFQTDYLKNKGLKINNSLQVIDDILFLPSDYFCPINQLTNILELSKYSFAIHWFSCSWLESKNKEILTENQERVYNFNMKRLDNWGIENGGDTK